MKRSLHRSGWLATAVAAVLLAVAPAAAQYRPLAPSISRPTTRGAPSSSSAALGASRSSPLGRGAVPSQDAARTHHQHTRRNDIVIPGQPRPDPTRQIIRIGPEPRPNARILRPGQLPPDPNRRIILPSQLREAALRGPRIVTVNGSSVAAMARALRSVGEHRLAASLCQRTGACGPSRSPAALNSAARRGAVNIRLPIDTRRVIYTANNRGAANEDTEYERMPRIQRIHGRSDPVAQRAYDKAGVILSFYRTVLGRQSFDDRNGPLRFVIHYGEDHDNASWNSAHESDFGFPIATFGDGNEESRAQFEGEIAYHEVTHGVVDDTANFEYEGESGALHEHFADAMAETAQQWEQGLSVREASWTFGEGTYHINAREGATRSFANPNLYGQPAHMNQWNTYDRSNDRGGVHVLNGIPNHAFQVAAMRLGGHSWEHVGPIWYAALRDLLAGQRNATFRDTAVATVRAATELFGERSREAHAVRAAWAEVGIRVPAYRGGPAPLIVPERPLGETVRPEAPEAPETPETPETDHRH